MTSVKFLVSGKTLVGFEADGHSTQNCDDENGRLVCSAISSAIYMAANTVTEIIGNSADIDVSDGHMYFKVKNPSRETSMVLEGLKLHIEQLAEEYSDNIKVYSEV